MTELISPFHTSNKTAESVFVASEKFISSYEIAKLKAIICSQVSVNKLKILNFRGLVVFLLFYIFLFFRSVNPEQSHIYASVFIQTK